MERMFEELFGAFQTALATAQNAQTALVLEPWETEAEFEARKATYLVSKAPPAQAYRRALAALEGATFFVDSSRVSLTVQPFDREAKAWVVEVVSSDPAIPWRGQVTYSLAASTDLANDYHAFDAALQGKTLQARLAYTIRYREAQGYRVNLNQVEFVAAGSPGRRLASIPVRVRYTFTTDPTKPSSVVSMIDLVRVAGSTFQRGSPSVEDHEHPVYKLTMSSFQMSATPVTLAEYQEVMGKNPLDFNRDSNAHRPVKGVHFIEAMKFCNQLSKLENLTPVYTIKDEKIMANRTANGYRLPTLDEWEYAARGGPLSQGYRYAKHDDTDQVAFYGVASFINSQPVDTMTGTMTPNELGLYDMSGNVWEWVCNSSVPYGSRDETNPWVEVSRDSILVGRGRGWFFFWDFYNIREVCIKESTRRYFDIGFRVVRP